MLPSTSLLSRSFSRFYTPAGAFWCGTIILWLLVLTLTPIAEWVAGAQTFPFMATLGVLAQFSAVLVTLGLGWKAHHIFTAFVIVTLGTWLAEYIGTQTGFPFGNYHYSNLLQPQFAGVPLIIPLAWLMMLPAAWAVTAALLQKHADSPLIFSVFSGFVFTAWDLYLDPQMVARDLWVWENPGGYFGIPFINFFGWWLTSTLLTLAVRPSFDRVTRRRLMVIYTLTWIFQAIGLGIFWGQPAPAFFGFIVMGFFAGGGWWQEWQTEHE